MAYRMIVAVLLLLSVPTMSSAWNKPGHMVTAAVAYEALKQSDPEALAATVALLHEHPHSGTMFRSQIEKRHNQAEEQDLYLFMLGARGLEFTVPLEDLRQLPRIVCIDSSFPLLSILQLFGSSTTRLGEKRC